MCQHFLLGDCKFGAACKRAHTFDSGSMKILSGRGLSPENSRNIHLIYKNDGSGEDIPVKVRTSSQKTRGGEREGARERGGERERERKSLE